MAEAAPPPRTRNALHTRDRILAAARVRFARHSYENVGTRDIAADAGVDAALVHRYFGSKDKLFDATLEGAFSFGADWPDDLGELGRVLVDRVLDDRPDAQGVDALRLLLRAAGNPSVAPRVSTRFEAEFVRPLADRLHGPAAHTRAALIAGHLIGLAVMRHGLEASALQGEARETAAARAAAAIQACVAP